MPHPSAARAAQLPSGRSLSAAAWRCTAERLAIPRPDVLSAAGLEPRAPVQRSRSSCYPSPLAPDAAAGGTCGSRAPSVTLQKSWNLGLQPDDEAAAATPIEGPTLSHWQRKIELQKWAVLGGRFGQPSGIYGGLDGDDPRFRPPEGSFTNFFAKMANTLLRYRCAKMVPPAQPAHRHQ